MIEERPNADDYLARAHRAEAALGEALILLDGSVEVLEKAGWDQYRADRDAHPVNTSPLMAVFLPVFGAAVALMVFA